MTWPRLAGKAQGPCPTVPTPHCSTPSSFADLRALGKQPSQLADELGKPVDLGRVAIGRASGLGPRWPLELTVAVHYVFDTPTDRLSGTSATRPIRTRSSQAAGTGIRTLRQGGGLSGFTRRSESEYDPFGAAHSSTSISSALASPSPTSSAAIRAGRSPSSATGRSAPAWPMRR